MFPKSYRWLICATAAAAIAACGNSTNTNSELNDFYARQLTGLDLPLGTFALTFDDGPSTRTTELAEFLADNNIKATFFVLGNSAAQNIAAVRTTHALGHTIGNHTYNHPALTKSSDPVSEIAKTDALIAPYIENNTFLFRAPFGDWSQALPGILNNTSLKKYVGSIFWDIGGELSGGFAADWACWGKSISVEDCGDMYLKEMSFRGRGIVLAHDVHSRTVDMFKYMVPEMRARGYQFVTVDKVPNIAAKINK